MNLIKKLIYVFVGLTLVCLIFLQKQRITVAFEGTRKVLDFKNYVQLLQTTNNLFLLQSKIVIQPQFNKVSRFSQGLAPVQVGNKWSYINQQCEKLIPRQFDETDIFHENLAAVKVDGEWGFINLEEKTVIPYQFDFALRFSEELAAFKINSSWSYINKLGALVIAP